MEESVAKVLSPSQTNFSIESSAESGATAVRLGKECSAKAGVCGWDVKDVGNPDVHKS